MFTDNLAISGGYQKLILRLSEELEKANHEVSVLTPTLNKEKCYPEIINNIKIISTKDFARFLNKANFFLKIKMVFQYIYLAYKIKKEEVIIIHNELSLTTLNFINTKNKKVLWMLNNQFPDWLKKEKVNEYEKSKLIIKLAKLVTFFLMKRGLKKVDLMLTYDSFNYNLVKANVSNNAQIIYAGADIEYKKVIREKIIYPIRLLSVGVLLNYRRYEDIIKAIDILRKINIDCFLKIVGATEFAPEYRKYLDNLVQNLKLEEKVIFCGAISDKELDNIYRNSDIFIFVNDAQTWGISVFEAISYELPVIITDNIGAADLVEESSVASIIKPGSPESIAEAIKKFKDNNLNQTEIDKQYKKNLEKVSWQSFATRMLAAISSINK